MAIKFAYDGTKFYGFARQPNLRTVEGELIKYLFNNNVINNTKNSAFRSASRTDKGVSAFGNVVAIDTNFSEKEIINKCHDQLKDIIIYATAKVKKDFYPRYAMLRQYRYYLLINNLDIEKIIDTASLFTGKHNYSNFARIEQNKNPERTIENIVFKKKDNYLLIDFFAQTFLWNQIRRIISALIKVGNNKLEKDEIINSLENPNKKIDFGLAPAKPLVLIDIFYNFEFNKIKKQLVKVKNLEKRVISSIKNM